MTGVTRFLGASIARMPGSVMEQLLGMRHRIVRFNIERQLRTVLLHTGGWFIQWHEGPADSVERTWEISRAHTTHHHPRAIHRSVGAASLVEPVQIAALAGPDSTTDVARKLFEIEGDQQRSVLEPAEIWRRLGAPPSGRFARLPEHPHHALAVVSEYTESVELIKALSEHCRAPMNYQRFAGPDLRTSDAGAAYVDIACHGRRVRIQALSRNVLRHTVARLAFARVDAVVVLLNRKPHSAAALNDAVAPFIAALSPEPAFHVVGLNGRSHLEAVLAIASNVHPSPHEPDRGESP